MFPLTGRTSLREIRIANPITLMAPTQRKLHQTKYMLGTTGGTFLMFARCSSPFTLMASLSWSPMFCKVLSNSRSGDCFPGVKYVQEQVSNNSVLTCFMVSIAICEIHPGSRKPYHPGKGGLDVI